MSDEPKGGEKPKNLAQQAFGEASANFGKEIAPLGTEAGAVALEIGRKFLDGVRKSVYGLEQIGVWLQEALAKRLKDVPPEKIVEPNPRIAVPATQALIYSMEDELIREMFANLLAADMNEETKKKAHPGFVEIIREMTPVDAKVLRKIAGRNQVELRVRHQTGAKWNEITVRYAMDIEGASVVEVNQAVSNLSRLGIVEIRQNEHPLLNELESFEKKLRDQFEPSAASLNQLPDEIKKKMGVEGNVTLIISKNGVFVTPFGQGFLEVCMNK